ncbi:mCG146895 [Mus musculus]|jgi:hypothetical protein|nr:mCG146895 [Mus musculus]
MAEEAEEIEPHFCKWILRLTNFLVGHCGGCEINQGCIKGKKGGRHMEDCHLSANDILKHLTSQLQST